MLRPARHLSQKWPGYGSANVIHLLTFEMVQQRIADYLHAASWQRAVAQYIRVLAGRAEIAGVDLGGTQTSLVQ